SGKQRNVAPAIPGNAYLFDLSHNPTVGLNTPFSTVRLNISQSALDALAHDRGLRHANGLRAPSLGCPDAVIHGLPRTLVAAMEQRGEGSSWFPDSLALAFHAHVLRTYGNVALTPLRTHGGLAPRQLRWACDFIEANLDSDPSIADIAAACDLSSSYFAKA